MCLTLLESKKLLRVPEVYMVVTGVGHAMRQGASVLQLDRKWVVNVKNITLTHLAHPLLGAHRDLPLPSGKKGKH